MPRPRRRRRVNYLPSFTCFGPRDLKTEDEVMLSLDEFEAVRLKDLEQLSQEEAAKRMNISQPTFHRLLHNARRKIAQAIISGKNIKIGGGNVVIRGGRRRGAPRYCVCPICGHVQLKVAGIPCARTHCEKCGSLMVRGD